MKLYQVAKPIWYLAAFFIAFGGVFTSVIRPCWYVGAKLAYFYFRYCLDVPDANVRIVRTLEGFRITISSETLDNPFSEEIDLRKD